MGSGEDRGARWRLTAHGLRAAASIIAAYATIYSFEYGGPTR